MNHDLVLGRRENGLDPRFQVEHLRSLRPLLNGHLIWIEFPSSYPVRIIVPCCAHAMPPSLLNDNFLSITFAEFRKRYEREKLPSLTKSSQESYTGALDSLELHIAPKRLASLTPAALSEYQAKLRARGNRETAIAARLRHVKAILNWAESMGLMAKAPRIDMPKRGKGSKAMRGRPITAEEFDRMLAAVPKVRRRDTDQWKNYLRGLWFTGLRLGESLMLSWDPSEAFTVDLSGKYPRFRIYGEAQKSGRDELLPMTPDAAEFFAATPEPNRTGLVFQLGQTDKRVCRIVSSIGRKANVVVDKAGGKFATAHDLRRSFGTRWARRVMPATLQRLMRHANIATTMAYYVDLQADDISGELWRQFGPEFNKTFNSGHFEALSPDSTSNGEDSETSVV